MNGVVVDHRFYLYSIPGNNIRGCDVLLCDIIVNNFIYLTNNKKKTTVSRP